jgi:NAD(P)-dependent dehydrogenase (short-subunit alcohol dehydrogenase family)
MDKLRDRVAIVTGGARGIGGAIVADGARSLAGLT